MSNKRDRVREVLAGICDDMRGSPEGFDSRCPFHSARHRSRSRTFSVNVERGIFYCQSSVCGRTGPLWVVLVELGGWSYAKARDFQNSVATATVRDLSQMVLPAWSADVSEKIQPLSPALLGLYDLCPLYMIERGFSKTTLRQWDIGFDSSAERVTFPVWSKKGELLGFIRRTIHPDVVPPYVNDFPRGKVLYGHHRVVSLGYGSLTVVEAPVSVLWLSQFGVPNVVATVGAKVSTAQVRMIAAERGPVILMFDGDLAGQAATLRVGSQLTQMGVLVQVAAAYPVGKKDPQECEDPLKVHTKTVPFLVWLSSQKENKALLETAKRVTTKYPLG